MADHPHPASTPTTSLVTARATNPPAHDPPAIPQFAEHPASAVGWISLSELSRVLGRSNARAARDWCARHHVEYRRDGKHNFARLEDVQRALEALPSRSETSEQAKVRAAAAQAASAIMAKRGR